jgi:hypothetical protein
MFSLTKQNVRDIIDSANKDIDYDAMHITSCMRSENEFFVKLSDGIGNLADEPNKIHHVKNAILTFGYEDLGEEEVLDYEEKLHLWKKMFTPLRLVGVSDAEVVLLLEDSEKYIPIPRQIM